MATAPAADSGHAADSAAQAFADKWLKALSEQGPALAELTDLDGFVQLMLTDSRPSAAQRKLAIDDARASHPIHPALALVPAQGVSHRLLRVTVRDNGDLEILTRVRYSDSVKQNYVSWLCRGNARAGYHIIDSKRLGTGAWFSDILNKVWRLQWAAERRGMLLRLAKSDSMTMVERYRTATGQIEADNATALASNDVLPPHLEQRPEVRSQRVSLLLANYREAGSDEARDALAAMLARIHDGALPAATGGLVSYDGWMVLGRYDRALTAANRLAALSGERDGWVELMRASAYERDGDQVMALEHAQKAVQVEPDLWAAHWSVLRLALYAKRYRDAQTIVREMMARFDWFPNDEVDYGKDAEVFRAFFETEVFRSLVEEAAGE